VSSVVGSKRQAPKIHDMAAAYSASVSASAQVCLICKARKKKCDKALPSCGYCIKKRLHCAYSTPQTKFQGQTQSYAPPSPPDSFQASPSPFVPTQQITFTPVVSATTLHLEVHRLIRSTGQFVDDITVRYFQGIHRYLPIISRTRFHNSLITSGATPSTEFSILLLAICVVASRKREGASNASFDWQQLHIHAKSLLAQVQSSSPVSVELIQAALLLSLHEYAGGKPDDALASIASCARMVCAALLHTLSQDF
jgi:hypothetical protein